MLCTCRCLFPCTGSSAGRRTGLDANVLAAYCKYAQEMEDLDASITSVFWVLFHKPTPDDEGGCRFDDLTWGKLSLIHI